MKKLEKRITFLQNVKLALEKAKQEVSSKLAEVKKQVQLKYQYLEELRAHMSKFEKAHVDSSKVISKLKVEFKNIKDQWEKSTFKIKAISWRNAKLSARRPTSARLGLTNMSLVGASRSPLMMMRRGILKVQSPSRLILQLTFEVVPFFIFLYNLFYILCLFMGFMYLTFPNSQVH